MNATITQDPQETVIKRKMRFDGTILKTTLAGAIVDIGQATPAILHISQMGAEPVQKVSDVAQEGQTVEVWVKRVDKKTGRIDLTMQKPMELEWRDIKKGMVVKGKVVRIEKFGVFLEIGAERPGLIQISELTHDYIRDAHDLLKEGDETEAKVLAVNRRKKQIKLSMKAMTTPVMEEEEETTDEAVPSAMEFALRQAMERNGNDTPAEEEKAVEKEKAATQELDSIITRTLDNKPADQR